MSSESNEPNINSPGGKTFKYVKENWSELEKPERVGLSILVVLLGKKNHVEHYIKNSVVSFLQKRL